MAGNQAIGTDRWGRVYVQWCGGVYGAAQVEGSG